MSNNRGEDTCLFTSASLQQLCPYIRKDQYVSQGGEGLALFPAIDIQTSLFFSAQPFSILFWKIQTRCKPKSYVSDLVDVQLFKFSSGDDLL